MYEKTTVELSMNEDQRVWLREMAAKHHLPDESKALRVLLDFAMFSGDESEIFETIRCRRC